MRSRTHKHRRTDRPTDRRTATKGQNCYYYAPCLRHFCGASFSLLRSRSLLPSFATNAQHGTSQLSDKLTRWGIKFQYLNTAPTKGSQNSHYNRIALTTSSIVSCVAAPPPPPPRPVAVCPGSGDSRSLKHSICCSTDSRSVPIPEWD